MAATANGNSKFTRATARFQLPALNIASSSLTDGTSIPPPLPSPPPPVPEKEKSKAGPARLGALNTHNKTSPPQTPNGIDSPNPLRSHPTSSHSLNRQLSPHADTTPAAASYANSKRMHSNTTPETPPPTKRPMSVRKLLSLRALNSAFNRDSNHHTSDSPASNKSGAGSSSGGKVYSNGNNKSSENLSLFSFRPSTSMSTSRPTLKKKRSSAFWGRKSSSFFRNAVPEDDDDDEDMGRGTAMGRTPTIEEKRTPPPTLPALDRLGAGRDLKEGGDGGFLGGGDMFRNIT